jgi:hypothetical protein
VGSGAVVASEITLHALFPIMSTPGSPVRIQSRARRVPSTEAARMIVGQGGGDLLNGGFNGRPRVTRVGSVGG